MKLFKFVSSIIAVLAVSIANIGMVADDHKSHNHDDKKEGELNWSVQQF